MRSSSSVTRSRRTRGDAPSFCSVGYTAPSACPSIAMSRCSGASSACERSLASRCAAARASCDLCVSLFRSIWLSPRICGRHLDRTPVRSTRLAAVFAPQLTERAVLVRGDDLAHFFNHASHVSRHVCFELLHARRHACQVAPHAVQLCLEIENQLRPREVHTLALGQVL